MSDERNTENLENNAPETSLKEKDEVRVDAAEELTLPSLTGTAELEKDIFGGREADSAADYTDTQSTEEIDTEGGESEAAEAVIEADFTEADETVLEEAASEAHETAETKEKPKNKGFAGKFFKALGIIFMLAFLAAVGFVGYKVWLYLQVYVYAEVKPVPATFSNETISLSIDSVELIDEIIGFELDENYVYVGVKYTVTNNTQEAVQWKAFPLVSVNEYVPSEDEKKPGYVLVEETSQPYELNGLRNYGIHQEIDFRNAKDDLAAGEARVSADIFKIAKVDYTAKEYFLTTDIFNEIVDLPDLATEDTVTDDTTVSE